MARDYITIADWSGEFSKKFYVGKTPFNASEYVNIAHSGSLIDVTQVLDSFITGYFLEDMTYATDIYTGFIGYTKPEGSNINTGIMNNNNRVLCSIDVNPFAYFVGYDSTYPETGSVLYELLPYNYIYNPNAQDVLYAKTCFMVFGDGKLGVASYVLRKSGINTYGVQCMLGPSAHPSVREYFDGVELNAEIPLVPGGISDTGGGDGAFEISSDIIEEFDVSKLISAINTGFMRAYAIKPTEIQLLRDLATYMWTSDFVDNLKKLWGDPMQVIMGLSAIPVTPSRGGVQNVVLGNVSSPVAMPPATSQYVVHNCGSITIKKYWGNYLDYKYTKASIYLPFIGGQELDIQKVMDKTLSLAYIIDIVSGACSAQLVADGSVIGNWQGSCAMGLPISAENFSRYYVGAISSAGAGLIKGASAGPIGALAGAVTGAAVNAVMNAPHVEMNGNVSGAGGYMSCRRPYIQLTLPRQSLAEIYNEIEGYPCNITYTLGELTGYTVVQNVHLENIIATADELEEIEELLKGGVIF